MKNKRALVVLFAFLLSGPALLRAKEERNDPLKPVFIPVARVLVFPVKILCTSVDFLVRGAFSVIAAPGKGLDTHVVHPVTTAAETATTYPVNAVTAGKDAVVAPFHRGMTGLADVVSVPGKVFDDASKVVYQPLVFVVHEVVQKPVGGATQKALHALSLEDTTE